MRRTITVKGIGKVSATPDYVVISMELKSQNMDYESAMDKAAQNIEKLKAALVKIGFDEKSIKTTRFNVRTDYEYIHRRNGEGEKVFTGYVVEHSLKLGFDFDPKMFAESLSAISLCLANPQLGISFTVKDPTAINEEMLRSATANAKHKAEILCEASGKELGELLSINYNWGELNIYSDTRYDLDDKCLAPQIASKCSSIDIEPDDIDITDTATFVWEIK